MLNYGKKIFHKLAKNLDAMLNFSKQRTKGDKTLNTLRKVYIKIIKASSKAKDLLIFA